VLGSWPSLIVAAIIDFTPSYAKSAEKYLNYFLLTTLFKQRFEYS
jgi:hypothetical protein